ncbi:hypothetical protein POPTR_014G116900v4 [Populus trichocarpa]|uniref:Golgi apparatus membrane protein TVP23 n=2 Tax=Populus trichocarpa TaxID=3694 RepID=A0A3N7FZX4_POPTR|nr:hypothetical protein POPTR_014G116900v4 [Populus trichocarpa]RQP00054.1 hypothetical protein POPTR_014G116900v4 [Populus trichocarpa]RQP00063.1 hypothetical protein POPTR_014G116900v4 [Populus trichocarpa]
MTFLYTVANNGSDYERNLCESKDMFLSSPLPVALRWWNEQGESVSQSLARLNKKDSWLFWWTLFLNVHAAAWVIIGIFSVKRFEADYVLVVAVCASLGIANIVGFTKCRKASAGDQISTENAKKQIQGFASQALASHFTSSIRSALGAV